MRASQLGIRVGVGVTLALTGCMPYSRPTLRPGSNVAVSKPPSPAAAVVSALLCTAGVNPDTNKVAPNVQRTCAVGSPADSATIPVKPPR